MAHWPLTAQQVLGTAGTVPIAAQHQVWLREGESVSTAIVGDINSVVAHYDQVSTNDGGGKEGSEIADVARW